MPAMPCSLLPFTAYLLQYLVRSRSRTWLHHPQLLTSTPTANNITGTSKLFMLAALLAVLLPISMGVGVAEVDGRHDKPQTFLPKDDSAKFLAGDSGSAPFFGRRARVLSPYRPFTCDNYPGICRAWGSPGPDCCRKQCVNLSRDMFNCGRCGRMCRYGQACCGRTCLNLLFDGRNCGACGTKCKKGSYCLYGMCSYA